MESKWKLLFRSPDLNDDSNWAQFCQVVDLNMKVSQIQSYIHFTRPYFSYNYCLFLFLFLPSFLGKTSRSNLWAIIFSSGHSPIKRNAKVLLLIIYVDQSDILTEIILYVHELISSLRLSVLQILHLTCFPNCQKQSSPIFIPICWQDLFFASLYP